MRQSTKVTLRIAAILVAVLMVLQCMGMDVGLARPFPVSWNFLTGWIWFLGRVRGQIQVRWDLTRSAPFMRFCCWWDRIFSSHGFIGK